LRENEVSGERPEITKWARTPIEYLLNWRMAMARALLRSRAASVAGVAQLVGYGSASVFSVAFSRHIGMPPAHHSQEEGAEPA